MSKKSNAKQNTPEIYVGLVEDAKNNNICLMEDNENRFSIFNSKAQLEGLTSYEALIKPTIFKVWANFNDFADTVNEQTTLAYHEQLFKANPPKKQDLITTKLHVWHKLIASAKNSMVSDTPKDPVTQRKSTITTRKYVPGDVKEGSADIKTYQALKSLELFRECLGEQEFVSEGVLKQYVIDHAAVLKTRQDPWRIFQYYRPQLIKAKLIRCV